MPNLIVKIGLAMGEQIQGKVLHWRFWQTFFEIAWILFYDKLTRLKYIS